MKKSGFSVLALTFAVAFTALQSGLALAQWGADVVRERVATPMSVAQLYHIMQQKMPDFTAWAMQTEAYKSANGFDKNVVLQAEVARLKKEFSGVSPFEPIKIKSLVRLSHYSEQTKGYLIKGISRETYFGYTFMGVNYAIVLPKLMDHEWIGVEGQQYKDVERAAAGNGKREVMLAINLRINYADKSPVSMDGKPYLLMSGDILSLEIYERSSPERPLWWLDSKVVGDAARQELMQLKR